MPSEDQFPPEEYFMKRDSLIARIRDGEKARAELLILEHQYPITFKMESHHAE